MKRLVIGILAHVDSGKTTLSEAMLCTSGAIRKLGRVDHGDSFLDNNIIERERGITVFSKQALMSFGNSEITLLDTPGHIDFSAETERTLWALDYAVLVISACDGIQNHTETLWQLLDKYNVPVFVFINKTDISDKTHDEIMSELKERLGDGCIDFSDIEAHSEEAAMCDEAIMDSFIESGKITDKELRNAIKRRRIFPCFFGSALKLDGIESFMNGLDNYTVSPVSGESFGAKVFKISNDEQGERMTFMKITGGSLKVRDLINGTRNGRDKWREKVSLIKIYSGARFSTAEEVFSGTVCAVRGLTQTFAGEGLGFEENAPVPVLEPVLTYKINLPDNEDIAKALANFRLLAEEDQQLKITWNEQLREINVNLMGDIQLEILQRIIHDRFGIDVTFDRGGIAYKETIANTVEGIGHYEPLRHYAEVHLLLEPAERGSGVNFYTDCSENLLDRNWQRLIMTHLEEKEHIGVLTGSPITDINITLVAGKAHQKHTEGGDFRQATYRAVRQGLRSAESVLLEPWYSFKLEVPQEMTGRALNDIQQMSGNFEPPMMNNGNTVITGTAPVSEMSEYGNVLIGYTHGKGRLICISDGYKPCHNSEEVIKNINYDCDRDIENTADSVFCSHGAGFNVKWDEVYKYSHIDSGLSFDDDTEEETPVFERVDYTADDKELMRIFEQTYGTVKTPRRDASRVMKTQKEPQKRKYAPIPQGPEYLLVDGYNIIFAWEDLKAAAKDSLDTARNILIDRMCNYRGFKQCELILVFDAYKVKGNRGEVEKVNNISVVYTKEAETADMYIEKTTHELGKKHRVHVATSDALEQLIILGNGAMRVSAAEFETEVKETEKKIREFLA